MFDPKKYRRKWTYGIGLFGLVTTFTVLAVSFSFAQANAIQERRLQRQSRALQAYPDELRSEDGRIVGGKIRYDQSVAEHTGVLDTILPYIDLDRNDMPVLFGILKGKRPSRFAKVYETIRSAKGHDGFVEAAHDFEKVVSQQVNDFQSLSKSRKINLRVVPADDGLVAAAVESVKKLKSDCEPLVAVVRSNVADSDYQKTHDDLTALCHTSRVSYLLVYLSLPELASDNQLKLLLDFSDAQKQAREITDLAASHLPNGSKEILLQYSANMTHRLESIEKAFPQKK